MTEFPRPSIYEKKFAKSDRTDGILVVDGKKLHVNKALLSYHSDYFNTLFNSEFKEKSMEEIPIEDVNFENFAILLSLVQEKPIEITEDNAESLLKLADRFLLSNAKFQVELFIKTSSKISRYFKLKLADKYNLENLLEHALGLYESKESFADFWHINNRQFSDSHKIMAETPKPSIYEKAFAKSDKTDAILVVDGKKLHVSKALLSYHSDFFKTLFNSEFKEKSMDEIPIEDVDFENFAILLSLVQEKPIEITKANAENILKLADRFLLNAAKCAIVIFIKTSSEFSRGDKLILADRHNLDDLLEYALGLYNSKETFIDFYYPWERNFSDSLKVKIFEKIFENCRDLFR